MKIKYGFVMHRIEDRYVVDTIGEKTKPFRRKILLNDIEAFIWKLLKKEISKEKILAAMLEEYDMDRKTAASTLQKCFSKLEKEDILEEDEFINLVAPDMSRLRDMRKERGYTQKTMQYLTGIDQSDYSKIENGRRYLSFEQCRRIALALHTSMDYLAGLTDIKEPYPVGTSRHGENEEA